MLSKLQFVIVKGRGEGKIIQIVVCAELRLEVLYSVACCTYFLQKNTVDITDTYFQQFLPFFILRFINLMEIVLKKKVFLLG